MRIIRLTLCVAAIISAPWLGFAQTKTHAPTRHTSSLSGQVTDAVGKPIAGATVQLSGGAGLHQVVTSDTEGNYSIKGLAAGKYDLSVSANGFKSFDVPGIALGVNDALPVDAVLESLGGTTAATPQQPAAASPEEKPAPAQAQPSPGVSIFAPTTAAMPTLASEKGKATLAGVVTDSTGAVIAGAAVTVSNAAGEKQDVSTNDHGAYAITGLGPGAYNLAVSAQGFNVYEAKAIALKPDDRLSIDASLEPAAAVTSVNVEGQKVAQVETESAQVSGTITQKEVVKIGLNGRNFTQLIALAPGVSNQTGQDEAKVGVTGSVKYSVNGGRVEYNTFDVDGSDVLNSGLNGAESTLIVYPSLDAIQEVKVLTSNYGAQYGRTASGTVVVNTKSGSSEFHGNAYEFVRNELFNARNYFDQVPHAPLYRRQDFGFTLGGPLFIPHVFNTKKDKTYFFFSEEFRLEKSPIQFNQAVPSLAERNGDFSDVCPNPVAPFLRSAFPDCPAQGITGALLSPFPNNQIRSVSGNTTLERNALAILNTGIIPAPNSTFGCNSTVLASCYVTTVSPPTYWREELFRIDHDINSKMRATFRYIHDSWDTTVTSPQWGFVQNSFPTIQNRFLGPGTSMVARLTHTITPSLLNEFVLSYVNSDISLADTNGPGAQFQRPAALDAPCAPDPDPPNPTNPLTECAVGYLFNNGFGGKIPGIVIGGSNQVYGGNGFAVDAGYQPWEHTNPTYSLTDNVSKVWGKHTLQFGSQFVLYQRNQLNAAIGAATGDQQGILTFNNQNFGTGNAFADFLIRYPLQGTIKSFQQDSTQRKYYQRYSIAEPYFQDDWRVTQHLTLNLGLRLSLFGTWHEQNLNAWNWDPTRFDRNLAAEIKVDPIFGNLVTVQGGQPIPLDPNNLDPHLTNGLVQCGTNGVPSSCMKGHLFNPAPRIGFAWDVRGDGKTSIRGGYGIFFEHGTGNEANTGSLEGSSPLVLDIAQTFTFGTRWDCIGAGTAPDCATAGISGAGAYPLNVTTIPSKAIWPYVQQWSFSVQRELPNGVVASIAYVGSKGTHLTTELQSNQLASPPIGADNGIFLNGNPFGLHEPVLPKVAAGVGDCAGFNGTSFVLLNGVTVTKDQPAFLNLEAACTGTPGVANTNALRTFAPGFARVFSLQNVADSQYHALQFTLRRTRGPLTMGVSYTFSHSLDDSSDRSDSTFVDSFNLSSNKASSNFDQRHLLNLSYVYQLPIRHWVENFGSWAHEHASSEKDASSTTTTTSGKTKAWLEGWEVSGITLFQTGTPFSVINGGGNTGVSALDNAGVANGSGAGSYPDVIGSPHSVPPSGGANSRSFGPLLLNPGAFAAPRGLTFGNAGRNFLNNPSRLNFDVALLKHFKLTEGTALEFRAEAFNVFNHTQFRIYDANLGNTGNNTISCYGPGAYNASAFGVPIVSSGKNLDGPDFSAAGGTSIVTQYSGGIPVSQTTQKVDCLTGSSFLHPVNAHRPRTLQLGIKISF